MITSFLFSNYRQRVLGLLLLHPTIRYHVREIARLTNTEAGTLHKELSRLAKYHVLLREVSGRQVYYQANRDYLIFDELVSILRKTSGFVDVLANALSAIEKNVEAAFVFGSMASGDENPNSDVDLLIIGKIAYADSVKALYPAQNILGREINPKVYQRSEWQKLLKEKSGFVKDILNKPKIFIKGSIDDIK